MGKRILALVLSLLLALTMVPFAAFADTEVNIVYIASTGNDENDGKTKDTAFRTIEQAYKTLGDAGGTIVVCDTITDDPAEWSSKVMRNYPHTGRITLTGKDPYTGEIYDTAQLYHNSVGFFGPTTLEYLTIQTHRNFGFMNTCGQEIIFGDGLKSGDSGFKFFVHDGIGETFGTTTLVPSTNTTINSGTFTAYYVGGGYPRAAEEGGPITGGVAGDCHLTINGGSISPVIGFDKYQSGDGFMNGSVFITVNGGEVNSIKSQNINEKTIEGAVQIILNNGMQVGSIDGPTAKLGTYIVSASGNGEIAHTATPGVFEFKAQRGYVAKIGGEVYENGEHKLSEGTTTVIFERRESVSVNKADGAYIKGYEDGTFRPQNNMTRAEAVTIVTRLVVNEEDIKGAYTSAFSDVEQGAWYYDNIAYLENIGALNSYSGTFSPNQNITRVEFVELICNIGDLSSGAAYKNANFSDVSMDDPRYSAISNAVSSKLVLGYPDGTFLPDGNITRAEVVTVINRFLKREPTGNDGENNFTDIADHWAKAQIAAASNSKISTVNGAAFAVWTDKDTSADTFVIPADAKSAKDYIEALYAKDSELTPSALVDGAQTIIERMKQDVLNAPDLTPVEGKTYYVSNNGNDANDGRTPETAWATLTKVNSPITVANPTSLLNPGDVVLFERGGLWRGNLSAKEGVSYGAYGEGPKPMFYGSARNYADESLWIETDVPNVYKFNGALTNVGIVAYDHTGEVGKYDEVVGFKEIVGVGSFKTYADLKKDLSFYSDLNTNEMFIYSSEGNPGKRFQSIEIGQRANIIRTADNVRIDNFTLKYGGAHGIGNGSTTGLTVTNSLFCWIGGSILLGHGGGDITGYGNAIEVFGSCDFYTVKNNWIYQIYDTGITHQNSSTTGASHQHDVNITENLVQYCHWSIEFYNPPAEDGSVRTVKNVYDAYNVLNLGGYGWGSINRNRTTSATLFNSFRQDPRTENFVCEKNIFFRSAGPIFRLYNGGDEKIEFKNNIYIQGEGLTLGDMYGTKYPYGRSVKDTLDQVVKDVNPIIIYVSRFI